MRGNSLLQERPRIRVFKNVQGSLPQKNWTSTTRTTRSGRTITTCLVLTFHTSRRSTQTCDNNSNGSQNTNLDVNTMIWGMFMIVTHQVAVHLGNDYSDNVHSTQKKNRETIVQCDKKVGQRAGRNSRYVHDQLENSWKRTTLSTDRTVQLSTAKAHVFSDSVL